MANSKVKIINPKLPEGLETINLPANDIRDEDMFSMGIVSDCTIENRNAEHVILKQMVFRNVIFKDVSLRSLDMTDVRFENCDLSNMDLSNSIIHRVEMLNCKVVGINIIDSTLRNVAFDQCNGKYACFHMSDFGQVSFRSCSLRNSDFGEASFSSIVFEHSDLQQSQMSGAKLKGIDLSSCDIEGLGVRLEDLYGTIVSPMQAVSLSKIIGLVIKD